RRLRHLAGRRRRHAWHHARRHRRLRLLRDRGPRARSRSASHGLALIGPGSPEIDIPFPGPRFSIDGRGPECDEKTAVLVRACRFALAWRHASAKRKLEWVIISLRMFPMFRILGSKRTLCDGLTRRDFLHLGGLGAFGMGLSDLFKWQEAQAASRETASGF